MKNVHKQIIITGQTGVFPIGAWSVIDFLKIFNSNMHINSLLSISKWAEYDDIHTSYITCYQYSLSYYSRGNPSAEYYITNSNDIAADSIGIFAFRIYCSHCWLRKDLYKYQWYGSTPKYALDTNERELYTIIL